MIPQNQNHLNNISGLLYALPAIEYDIVLLSSKGRSPEYIARFMTEGNDLDDENSSFLNSLGSDTSEIIIANKIKEFINQEQINHLIESIKEQHSNRTMRKVNLEQINFEVYTELTRRIKRNELGDLTVNQLVSMAEKMQRALHLEEEKNKEDIKDAIKIFEDVYKSIGAKPIIQGNYNIYDVDFFGTETANNDKFITPDEFLEDA